MKSLSLKYTYLPAAVCAAVILVFAGTGSSQELTPFIEGRVIAVVDGDTFTVQIDPGKQFKVRLQGVNAPEKQQPFGPESRQNLATKVMGKIVRVEFTKMDNIGRVLGKVMLDDEDVGLEQLSSGLGWLFTHYANELNDDDRLAYRQAQDEARRAKLGLWKDKSPVSPWAYRLSFKIDEAAEPADDPSDGFLGNSRTKLYRKPNCPGYRSVPAKYRVSFSTAAAAERAGFRLPKNCR